MTKCWGPSHPFTLFTQFVLGICIFSCWTASQTHIFPVIEKYDYLVPTVCTPLDVSVRDRYVNFQTVWKEYGVIRAHFSSKCDDIIEQYQSLNLSVCAYNDESTDPCIPQIFECKCGFDQEQNCTIFAQNLYDVQISYTYVVPGTEETYKSKPNLYSSLINADFATKEADQIRTLIALSVDKFPLNCYMSKYDPEFVEINSIYDHWNMYKYTYYAPDVVVEMVIMCILIFAIVALHVVMTTINTIDKSYYGLRIMWISGIITGLMCPSVFVGCTYLPHLYPTVLEAVVWANSVFISMAFVGMFVIYFNNVYNIYGDKKHAIVAIFMAIMIALIFYPVHVFYADTIGSKAELRSNTLILMIGWFAYALAISMRVMSARLKLE